MNIQVTVTRLYPSGGVECSAVINRCLERAQYYGYSEVEARAMFRESMREKYLKTGRAK